MDYWSSVVHKGPQGVHYHAHTRGPVLEGRGLSDYIWSAHHVQQLVSTSRKTFTSNCKRKKTFYNNSSYAKVLLGCLDLIRHGLRLAYAAGGLVCRRKTGSWEILSGLVWGSVSHDLNIEWDNVCSLGLGCLKNETCSFSSLTGLLQLCSCTAAL